LYENPEKQVGYFDFQQHRIAYSWLTKGKCWSN